jgi:WD40 repeat protein
MRMLLVERPVILTESLRQLDGHSNRVTGLSWSTHIDGFLATASYDGTSQVVFSVIRASVSSAFVSFIYPLIAIPFSGHECYSSFQQLLSR